MVNNKSIKVSLIVPVYNVALYLRKCLNSLINQTLKEIEVIIINDGSTDNSGKIVDEYAKKDSRVKVIHQENQGLSFARNQGIKLAKGKYIAFVDSDDWVKEDAYAVLFLKAEENGVDIVLGDLFYYTEGKEIYRTRKYFFDVNQVYNGKKCFVKLIDSGNYGAMVCMNFYRLDFIRNNHLYFEFLYHEDEYFTPRAFYYAKRVIDARMPFYYYRQREGSIMHNVDRKVRVKWICRIVDQFFCFAESNLRNEDSSFIGAFMFRAISLYMSITWLYVLMLRDKKDCMYLPAINYYQMKGWEERLRGKEQLKLKRLYYQILERQRRLVCFNQGAERIFPEYKI